MKDMRSMHGLMEVPFLYSIILWTDKSGIVFFAGQNNKYWTVFKWTHTVFNLAKYRVKSTNKKRILQTDQELGICGFWAGNAGVAAEGQNGIYAPNTDKFGTECVLSSQTPNLYRGNCWNSPFCHVYMQ